MGPRSTVPFGAVLASACGTAMMAAGLIALVAPEVAKMVPGLTDAATAWALIAAGIAIEAGAMVTILRRIQPRT